MKEWHHIKIIGVDHGYGNIKTANTVTPTNVIALKTEPIFSGNILEYQGMYYRIGDGHKEFTADKVQDDDYYVLTLIAVARELNIVGLREANVQLAAGLPLTWIRRQREAFRAYLMRSSEVRYRFNGKDYYVRFVGCDLFPQGYPAIVQYPENTKVTHLLADIGNGTMNILYMVGKKAVESKCWTEKLGVNQCIIAARNEVLEQCGQKVDDAIIEQVLRFGTADIGTRYLDCIRQTGKEYAAQIFAALKRYEYDPELMRLTIVGGGGCLIRNFGEYQSDRVTIVNDICATAKGYEFLALSALRRKEGERVN